MVGSQQWLVAYNLKIVDEFEVNISTGYAIAYPSLMLHPPMLTGSWINGSHAPIISESVPSSRHPEGQSRTHRGSREKFHHTGLRAKGLPRASIKYSAPPHPMDGGGNDLCHLCVVVQDPLYSGLEGPNPTKFIPFHSLFDFAQKIPFLLSDDMDRHPLDPKEKCLFKKGGFPDSFMLELELILWLLLFR
ncbi:hypothetical protein LXL04_001738 [Taraxacum kok-saghyz]